MTVLEIGTGRRRLSAMRVRLAVFAMAIAVAPVPSRLMAQGGVVRLGRSEMAAERGPRLDSTTIAFALRTPLRIRIVPEQSLLGLAPDQSRRSSHVWLGALIGAAAGGRSRIARV